MTGACCRTVQLGAKGIGQFLHDRGQRRPPEEDPKDKGKNQTANPGRSNPDIEDSLSQHSLGTMTMRRKDQRHMGQSAQQPFEKI